MNYGSKNLDEMRIVRAFTIDAEHSYDLDDAIDVERDGSGWKVTIAIANVADSIRDGSQSDVVARERAMTIYVGARVRRSMLPQELIGALTLGPGVERPAVYFDIRLDAELEVVSFEATRATFVSSGRLSYDEIPMRLRDRDALGTHLRLALNLAKALRAMRLGHGAIFLDDPDEPKSSSEISPGHLIVSEMMILANAAASRYARDRGLPVLFRNHGPRDENDPIRVRMAADTGRLRIDLHQLSARGHEYDKATYESYCGGHMGLALSSYGHFTSPLRRYADVANQRALLGIKQSHLDELGFELTEKTRAITDERSASFKDAVKRQQARVAESDGFAKSLRVLDASQFVAYLKRDPAAIGAGGAIDEAIQDRLDRLSHAETAYILFLGEPGSETVDAAITRLARTLSDVPTVVSLAEQQLSVEKVVTIEPQPAGGFLARATLSRLDRSSSAERVGTNKAEAKNLAMLAALVSYCGVQLAVATPSANDLNPKSVLTYLVQHINGSFPSFEAHLVTDKPSGSAPEFIAVVSVTIEGQDYRAEATGSSSKNAERAAAAALLPTIEEYERSRVASIGAAEESSDWISELNQLFMDKKIGEVTYTFEPINEGFVCKAQTTRAGASVSCEGRARSKSSQRMMVRKRSCVRSPSDKNDDRIGMSDAQKAIEPGGRRRMSRCQSTSPYHTVAQCDRIEQLMTTTNARVCFYVTEAMTVQRSDGMHYYRPAIVKENESGYYPTDYDYGSDFKLAYDAVVSCNADMGVNETEMLKIVASSMGASRIA